MTEQEYQQSVVTDYLRRLVDKKGRGPSYTPADALLAYGGLMSVVRERPAYIKLGAPKHCYSNTVFGLVSQGKNNPDELFYCEGFAIEAGGLWLPIQHAWLADAEGRVVDPTWEDAERYVYFGVAFKTSFVFEMLDANGMVPGLLDTPELMRRYFGSAELFAEALEELVSVGKFDWSPAEFS